MAFGVVYGKTKLVSAVSGGAILDAGDLNYSIEHTELTDTAQSASFSGPRSSLYTAVSNVAEGTYSLTIPREWEENNDAQRDGRGTGWRIRIYHTGISTLPNISIISELQTTTIAELVPGEMLEFIFSTGFTASKFIGGNKVIPTSTNYLIYNPAGIPV